MEMTEEEIVSKYIRNGKDRKQISILAELNGTSRQQIIEILVKHEVMEPIKKSPHKSKIIIPEETIAKIVQFRKEGCTLQSISQWFGYSTAVIRRVLKEAGGVTPEIDKKLSTLRNIRPKKKRKKPGATEK